MWVHTRLSEKDRTQRLTRRNRGRFGWGWYHYSRSVPHVHQHPRAGYQNGKLCRFWGLVVGAPEGVAAPLDFSLLLKLHLCAPRSGLSTLARCGGVTTALGMLCALSKCSVRRFQNGLHLCPHSGVGNIPTFPQRIAHNVSHVEGGSFSSEATVASDLPSDFYKYVNCINNSACRFCCNCFCGMVR